MRDSMTKLLPCLLTVCVFTSAVASAQNRNQPILNAKDGGVDFEIQGEYSGVIKESADDEQKIGVQVIAQGDGKFHAVVHIGGLPGDGWDGKEKKEVDGKLVDGVATFVDSEDQARGVIQKGVLRVSDADGKLMGTLKKVVRKSTTLGKTPPENAVVLFDGKNADAFKGGRMTSDGCLMHGCTSKQLFGSFNLHLEFQLSFMPYARGQGRSNSGCYMQGRYEVQVLDSFGLKGKNNECGGIYSIKDPDLNMCYPPLSWQTYDVEYTAAKYEGDRKVKNALMTVRHNGVLVHRDVELPKGTTAHPTKEGPEPGPIYLQNHGNPLKYRNIWVVPVDR